MGKVKELTTETRSAIMTLIEEGYSQREIATKLKISKVAVRRTIQRYSCTIGFKDKPRSGRPRVTTKTDDLHIITISKRSRKKTAPEIRAEINEMREKSLSVSTIQRRFRHAGIFGRVAVRKPLLRPQNKIKQLEWAKTHQNWTDEDFNRVLWSDDSEFEVFGSNRRVYR